MDTHFSQFCRVEVPDRAPAWLGSGESLLRGCKLQTSLVSHMVERERVEDEETGREHEGSDGEWA